MATPATKSKPVDTSTWLTRNEASDLLGCSANTLMNYERRGKLHPATALRTDQRGIEHEYRVYDPRELAKLPNRTIFHSIPRPPGEIAARAFEAFAKETPLCDIVVELRETPDHVQKLYEQWLDMRGARYVLSDEARAALAKRIGPFADVAELVEIIERKVTP